MCRFNAVEQDYNEQIFLTSELFLVIGDMLPILKIPKKLLLQFFLREIINGLGTIISNKTTGKLTEHFQEFTQGAICGGMDSPEHNDNNIFTLY